MNKWIKIAALTVALPLSVAANAKSMDGVQGHRGGMKNIIAQLDLTDAQKQEVKTIMQQALGNADRESRQAQRSEHHAERLALLNAAQFDEAKARTMIAGHQQHMADKQVGMLKMQHQVFQVLTPEQRTQFAELMTQGKGRGSKHH